MKEKQTEMICADLEGFRLAHNKANFPSFLVLEELDSTSASLFPLVSVFVKTIELRLSTKKKN